MIALLGWGALALNLIAYFITQPRKALIALAGSEIAWLAFHLSMGWLSAIFISTLTIVRNLLGGYAPDKVLRPALLIILVLITGILYTQAVAWYNYMPILAAGIETITVWMRNNPLAFRLTLILSETAWIVFAWGVASWPNGLCAVFGILILSYKIKTQTLSSPAV